MLGSIVMTRRVRVVDSCSHVRGDIGPVLPPKIVDGSEGMQRRQGAVYETRKRMELGRFPSDKVTIQIGSQLVHAPLDDVTLQIERQGKASRSCIYARVEVSCGGDLRLDIERSIGVKLQISSYATAKRSTVTSPRW